MVGASGFEPLTTRTPSVCATRLRYAPIEFDLDFVTPRDGESNWIFAEAIRSLKQIAVPQSPQSVKKYLTI